MQAVGFKPIVDENSILRRLPTAIDPVMRMRIDAIVFSADAISHHWNILREIACFLGENATQIGDRHRVAMLSAAWSIIDELHAIRQLASDAAPDENGKAYAADLYAACEPVGRLRDKMRHLASNLKNLGKKKKHGALLGSLSWLWSSDLLSGRAHLFLLKTGMSHQMEDMGFVNPKGKHITPPADLFQLEAFGISVILGEPILTFFHWINAISERWQIQIDAEKAAFVGVEGGPTWEMIAGGFVVGLEMEYDPAEILAPAPTAI